MGLRRDMANNPGYLQSHIIVCEYITGPAGRIKIFPRHFFCNGNGIWIFIAELRSLLIMDKVNTSKMVGWHNLCVLLDVLGIIFHSIAKNIHKAYYVLNFQENQLFVRQALVRYSISAFVFSILSFCCAEKHAPANPAKTISSRG
jgi:hypothetical protein